jgi:hypothetical protein
LRQLSIRNATFRSFNFVGFFIAAAIAVALTFFRFPNVFHKKAAQAGFEPEP